MVQSSCDACTLLSFSALNVVFNFNLEAIRYLKEKLWRQSNGSHN